MGAVIRRTSILFALFALLVPAGAHASTTTYGPAYGLGPAGGDEFNLVERDAATGEMSIIRYNPVPANGGLGCGGSGGWATFTVAHTVGTAVDSVVVSYTSALVDPYSFMSVSMYQNGAFIDTQVVRGPTLGEGTITLDPRTAASGDVTIMFGLQVASACPNVDIARATFSRVDVNEV